MCFSLWFLLGYDEMDFTIVAPYCFFEMGGSRQESPNELLSILPYFYNIMYFYSSRIESDAMCVPQCYCYVCDKKAGDCLAWGTGMSVRLLESYSFNFIQIFLSYQHMI